MTTEAEEWIDIDDRFAMLTDLEFMARFNLAADDARSSARAVALAQEALDDAQERASQMRNRFNLLCQKRGGLA